MKVPFSKYAGSGNDFILLDNRDQKILLELSQIQDLCDRRQGIGADGIIMMEKGSDAPLKMRIFNSDGSEAEMCGNGIRCFYKYMEELGVTTPVIESKAGKHTLEKKDHLIKASMTDPKDLRWKVKLSDTVTVDYIDTGVPHAILFVHDIDAVDINTLGPFIRRHKAFDPKGANANFVEILSPGRIKIRTFERGVEGETLACGTGATAAAIIYALTNHWTQEVEVIPASLEPLIVDFKQTENRIGSVHQTGPAKLIFHGSFHLKDRYAAEDHAKKTSL